MTEQSKDKNETFGKIIVKVKKLHPKALVLRQTIAAGETPGGEKFEIDAVIPSGSFYISFPGTKPREHYLIDMRETVSAALDLREKKKANTPSYPEVGEDGAIPGLDTPHVAGNCGNAGDYY